MSGYFTKFDIILNIVFRLNILFRYGATRARSMTIMGGGVENGGETSTHAIPSIYTRTLAFRMASLILRRNAVVRTTSKEHRRLRNIRESAINFPREEPNRS